MLAPRPRRDEDALRPPLGLTLPFIAMISAGMTTVVLVPTKDQARDSITGTEQYFVLRARELI
eukprot:7647698-Pyramimonas_sp.AAC.1